MDALHALLVVSFETRIHLPELVICSDAEGCDQPLAHYDRAIFAISQTCAARMLAPALSEQVPRRVISERSGRPPSVSDSEGRRSRFLRFCCIVHRPWSVS